MVRLYLFQFSWFLAAQQFVFSLETEQKYMMSTEPEEPRLTAVSIKLPPFWTGGAEAWFNQAEGQFITKGITASITKYYYVIQAFSQEMSRQFYDLLRTPPPGTPYETLKTRVLKHYSMTDYQRFESIMALPFSPDERPSNLMNNMLSLMPDGYTPDFIFKSLFLRRLPHEIRVFLLKSMDKDPREVANEADELWQDRTGAVNSCTNLEDDVRMEDVNVLRNQHSNPQRRHVLGRQQQRRQSDNSQMNPSSFNTHTQGELCFYHDKYGNKAQKCRSPCLFPGNGMSGRRN